MRIVCAPDSFKESISALEAAHALADGVQAALPDAVCDLVPMADGGEGTTETLVDALDGTLVEMTAEDAIGRPRSVTYGYIPSRRLAVIEVANTIGLAQISPSERDAISASSFGAGEMIRHALNAGAENLIIGLGGSATTDGGAGWLTALGARLLDADDNDLPRGGDALRHLSRIDLSGLDQRLVNTHIELACDVDNPLVGPQGAAAVFGPQKGATPAQVVSLDHALTHLADILEMTSGKAVRNVPGAGAAGGFGVPLLAFGKPSTRPGVEIVADAVGLAHTIAGADWVFTGEGSVDHQTLHGKTPMGVLQLANANRVPTVVFGGRISDDARPLLDAGAVALVPIVRGVGDMADALANARQNLSAAAEMVTRLIVAAQSHQTSEK